MKIVYVAGPFRGATRWEVVQNVRRAELVALGVAMAGAMPLCPHTNTANFDGLITSRFWLDGTMEMLRRCDAVILVEGWRDSAGTCAEIQEAHQLKIPVFVEGPGGMAELRRWLDKDAVALDPAERRQAHRSEVHAVLESKP